MLEFLQHSREFIDLPIDTVESDVDGLGFFLHTVRVANVFPRKYPARTHRAPPIQDPPPTAASSQYPHEVTSTSTR